MRRQFERMPLKSLTISWCNVALYGSFPLHPFSRFRKLKFRRFRGVVFSGFVSASDMQVVGLYNAIYIYIYIYISLVHHLESWNVEDIQIYTVLPNKGKFYIPPFAMKSIEIFCSPGLYGDKSRFDESSEPWHHRCLWRNLRTHGPFLDFLAMLKPESAEHGWWTKNPNMATMSCNE